MLKLFSVAPVADNSNASKMAALAAAGRKRGHVVDDPFLKAMKEEVCYASAWDVRLCLECLV